MPQRPKRKGKLTMHYFQYGIQPRIKYQQKIALQIQAEILYDEMHKIGQLKLLRGVYQKHAQKAF